MSMIEVEEFFGHGLGPDVGMFFAAARAEFAFTTKVNDFCFTAMRTNICGEAAAFGAAVEHFFGFMEDMFRKLILIEFFKEDPVIITFEDRFKSKFSVHDNRDYNRTVKS